MTHEGWPKGGNYRHGQSGKQYAGEIPSGVGAGCFWITVVLLGLFIWGLIATWE